MSQPNAHEFYISSHRQDKPRLKMNHKCEYFQKENKESFKSWIWQYHTIDCSWPPLVVWWYWFDDDWWRTHPSCTHQPGPPKVLWIWGYRGIKNIVWKSRNGMNQAVESTQFYSKTWYYGSASRRGSQTLLKTWDFGSVWLPLLEVLTKSQVLE